MPSYAFPPAPPSIDPTPLEELDRLVARLAERKAAWAQLSIDARLDLLDRMKAPLLDVAEDWVDAGARAKGFETGSHGAGEEWFAGPAVTMRNLRLLEVALRDVRTHGRPVLTPDKLTERPDGRLVAQVFPLDLFDKVLFSGFTAETWMQPGVTRANLPEHQASAYRDLDTAGRLALVLGAGNVSSIAPTDVLYKLFVENEVVILKMNPVNEYIGPFLEQVFAPLIERGFLAVVYGGVEVGKHLTDHPQVETIHITGSDATHDAILWGPPEGRAERKAKGEKRIDKEITSELGNVTPVIVVPGPWTDAELQFQAENVATMVEHNASFDCNAAKLLVLPAGWDLRERFLDKLKAQLRDTRARKAYYPGARERWQRFVDAHPEAEILTEEAEGIVPWTFIGGLDPEHPEEICFRQEPFCGVIHEVSLPGRTAVDFLPAAVAFCNDKVWGTLACHLLIHPTTRKDPACEAAFQEALDDLRYGGIGVNHWAGLIFGLISTTWGAFPGHTLEDIQSGRGVVHNTFMFDKPEKSVLYGPFTMFPKPPWFVTFSRPHKLAPRLVRLEANPGLLKLPGIALQAILG